MLEPQRFSSLLDLLRQRACMQGSDRAYIFVSDRGNEEAVLSFAELERRARALGRHLCERHKPASRALLMFLPGLDFIVAFLGCLYAGIIAVPMMVPRRASLRDASSAIIGDCQPETTLLNKELVTARPDVLAKLQNAAPQYLIIDEILDATPASDAGLPLAARSDVAFLQYTSGSTSSPKGVVVTHGNLLDNLEMIRRALGNSQRSTYVSWMPLYHDMGLILNVLETLYLGSLCVLLSPVNFMQRPMTWLRAIDAYRAEVGCAPNFAFDLCVSRFRPEQMQGADLSCWKVALNGAEPIRAETLARFAAVLAPYGFDRQAIYPAYGLAEATLLVSGGSRGAGPRTQAVSREALQCGEIAAARGDRDRQVVVGCGRSLAGEEIAIVEPQSCRRLGCGGIGEIWVRGPNVTRGYWQNPEVTAAIFGGRIRGEAEAPWLRTGDLGFLDDSGELYVTGRIKDVIIIRGMNHYPQDIENTMQSSHPALRPHGGAAFCVADGEGGEKLVLIQEVERAHRHHVDIADLAGSIREAVITEHDIAADEIVLVQPGVIPKTTSGKIQRSLARQLWLEGKLLSLGRA